VNLCGKKLDRSELQTECENKKNLARRSRRLAQKKIRRIFMKEIKKSAGKK